MTAVQTSCIGLVNLCILYLLSKKPEQAAEVTE